MFPIFIIKTKMFIHAIFTVTLTAYLSNTFTAMTKTKIPKLKQTLSITNRSDFLRQLKSPQKINNNTCVPLNDFYEIPMTANYSREQNIIQTAYLTFKPQPHRMVKHTQTINQLFLTNCLSFFLTILWGLGLLNG